MPDDPHPACRAEVELPFGSRALVLSDLFLGAEPTEASTSASREVARALDRFEGPGAVIVAGNLFDLLGARITDPAPALEAHPELADAFRRFGGEEEGRHIVVLPGSRDRAILYDKAAKDAVTGLGATIALDADLQAETLGGTKIVRVDPGWRWDERYACSDPFNPSDTPLGHHLIGEVLPRFDAAGSTWLAGLDRLVDQSSMPRFVASRLIYRRIARFMWWLLVPVVLALLVRFPGLWAGTVRGHIRPFTGTALFAGSVLIGELILVGGALAYLNYQVWRRFGPSILGPPGLRANDSARDAARDLVAGGATGLVIGHSLQPEVTRVGPGFFASTGACAEVVTEHRSRLALPPVFLHQRQVCWVEVEAGAELHARLVRAQVDLPAGTLVERLASGRRKRTEHEPAVVASYPSGGSWPPMADPSRRIKRVRRMATVAVALLGLLDLVSAVVPPLVRGRLHPLLHFVPLGVSETAGALVALAGIGLLALARGIRRGQRLAWYVTTGLLFGTAILHLVKNLALVQSLAALVLVAYLVWFRDCFRTRFDFPSLRNGVVVLVAGAAGLTVLSAIVLEATLPFDRDHPAISFFSLLWASAGRLAGFDTVALPHVVDVFLDPVLLTAGITLVVMVLVLASRPVVDRRVHHIPADASARARDILARRGSGTLDYFALRSDKQWFFDRDGIVAYAIHGGVCLVSPDPIGPVEERDRLWSGFRRYADEHGWSLAVLGASEEWLPVYRRSGMRDLYVGDEAVTDVRTFSLEGGTHKGLRQAVNRIAKYGYTISFHDPATVDPALAAALRGVMTKSRRGQVERGFSMTLGRIFDPADHGLLLAVASGPTGDPVAFCQYVPAPGIDGFSLDLMRRDDGDHPNGLLDFILVNTIRKLREDGYAHLGLNFATMRAVLAGESGPGISQRLERWLLRRMSDSMQIESLWRFNAKFDPEWFARYVVWDSAEQSLPTALAIAKAESFWELPLIGRFFVPSAGAGDAPAEAVEAGESSGVVTPSPDDLPVEVSVPDA
jgi:lysylphosphatidylglycerol synthetase-like protein (DUF2156 family)